MILKKMVQTIIQYFNHCTDLLKELVVLLLVFTLVFWKSKGLSD